MTGLAAILASALTVGCAVLAASNIERISGWPDALVWGAMVLAFALHIAIWVGSFNFFCNLLGDKP